MKEIIKKKWFMAIVVALAAGSLFLVSFGISRSWTGKVAGKEGMQVAEQKKQEKDKFINKNVKDEKAKEIIKLQDKINEAKKNGQDPDEAIDQELRARNYTEDYKRYIELPEEEKENLEIIPREQVVDEKEFDVIKEEQDEKLGELTEDNKEEIIPEKFDLRDKIDIKVENQMGFGLCWDFASNSALETNLALTKGLDYDFSEIHVDYMTSDKMNSDVVRELHEGGRFNNWFDYVCERQGLVLEDKLDYRDYSDDELIQFYNVDKEEIIVTKIAEFPDFSKETVGKEKFKEYQNIVKRHIMNYGGINAAIHYDMVPDVFNTDERKYSNHEICIIGWDDNYSRENFKDNDGQSPKENGAYIALNSHGMDSGYNGYIYISYEDENVSRQMYGIVSTDLSDAIPLSEINNEAIENFVRQNCSIIYNGNEEYVLDAEISQITKVDLSNTGLTSLEGIELFKCAINVNISDNNITDLTPITKLEKLLVLNASNNNIKDASILAECPKLYSVNLSGNKDVTGYEKCVNIESLQLSDCNITSVESINQLTELYSLDISKNSNIEDLDKLNIKTLYLLNLSECNISDISTIINQEKDFNPTSLNLSYNNIQNIDCLKDSNNMIWELNLSGNKQIEDFSPLNDAFLKELIVKDCNIKSFAQLPTKNNEIYTIDVSNNDIGNDYESLESMESLFYLVMQNCNLEDISDIEKAGAISELDLSYNPNVRGDLRNIPLEYITIYDCDIENVFNVLKLGNERRITFNTNGIVKEETLNNLPENIKVTGATLEKTISVPKDKIVYLYTSGLAEEGMRIMIDSINDRKCSLSIPTKLDLNNDNISSITARINYQDIVINFVKDDSIKPSKIEVAKMPNTINSIDNELFEIMKFEEKYGNGVYTPLEDYEVWYDKDNIHQGSNYIKITADGLKKEFYINLIGEDNSITLQFEDEELYNRTVKFCDENSTLYGLERVGRDDNNKTIKLTKEMKYVLENVGAIQSTYRIPYESLYDLKALQGLNIYAISIEFSENSDAKITEADLEQFKKSFNTRLLGIYDYNEYTFKRDRIVDQDEYVIDYIHKSGPKTTFLRFSDKTYEYIKDRFEDNIYVDYEECQMIALTDDQIEALSNEGLTISYEGIEDDIYSLTMINLHKLTIEFSEESYKQEMLTEEHIELLSQIENLDTLYLVDLSGKRNIDNMIIDQNKFTVYFNGELYYEKTDEEEEIVEPTNFANNEIYFENDVINIEATNNVVYNNVISNTIPE